MEDVYFPSVVQAVPGDDKTVYAYFSDGSIRFYDMKPLIAQGHIFKHPEDDTFFRDRLTVLNETVTWDLSGNFDPTNCIDIDPFTVYEDSEVVSDPLEEAI